MCSRPGSRGGRSTKKSQVEYQAQRTCNRYLGLIVIRGDRGFHKKTLNKVNCHAGWNFPPRPPAQNNIFHKINFPRHSEEKYSPRVDAVS